jgi:hypothetical protein
MEPPPEILIPAELILEDLHRHIAVEPVASGPIYHRHTATSDLL